MGYTLENFCSDAHDILSAGQGQDALEAVADKLKVLVVNPDFVAATFSDDMPPCKQELWHDPETDMLVLAHVQKAGKSGKPHSHGQSWAVYANCRGVTNMTEWRRTNADTDQHAELDISNNTRWGRESKAYGPGVIHSTAHPDGAWVIRVTGGDLDRIARYRFDPKKDKMPEPV